MVSHSVHPDSHEFGLADNCPRCAQHALLPTISLDDENLTALIWRVIEGKPSRSTNERHAMTCVEGLISGYRKLRQLVPSLEFEEIKS